MGTRDQRPDWQVPGYADVQELGRGGFGRVVLARRLVDGAPVAVKYLADRLVGDPEFRAEFQREARTLAGLRSPYTVRLYEYVETGDPVSGAAIVMEYVPGASLRRLLGSAGGMPMPPQAALGILKGSLLGLGAAHGLGVVHRDYKPENVLVRPEGGSVLADFGIAVRAGDLAAGVVGTPPYMAPEQFAGASPSAAADVYAATAVFFECVTGRRPIDVQSRDLESWAHAHRAGRVPLEMAPAPVQGLIARGLAKDPGQRPAQALAFAAELERAAVQAYGPDWERIGWQVLVGALSGLAATGVLLSLVPGLLGPAVPVPLPVPPPIPGVPAPPPALPAPTMGPPAPSLPPGTPGPAHPGVPGLGSPSGPVHPSAPQSPYPHPQPHPQPHLQPHPQPHPRIPRHHPWRHLKAKLGAGKAVATVTAAVVAVAGGTTAVVVANTHDGRSSQAAALSLGPLVGDWGAHGAGLTIKPDGTFTITLRIYGGRFDDANGSGHLTKAANGVADGRITQSDHTSGDSAIPLGPMHVVFSPGDDTIKVSLSGGSVPYMLCGPHPPNPDYCGA